MAVRYDQGPMEFDQIDSQILCALDSDPRKPGVALSDHLGLARGTIQAHLSRLETQGLLRPHSTRAFPEKLGYRISAMISADLDQTELESVVATLQDMPEVLEAFATSGDQDILVRVAAVDTDHLYLIGQRLLRNPGVRRTRTTLVLRELVPYRVRPLLEARATGSRVNDKLG